MRFSPRRKKETGRWDFTCLDDTQNPPTIAPFGYCKEHWDGGQKNGHHDSPEAAVHCFLDYIFDHELNYGGTCITLLSCAACGERTMGCVTRNGEMFMVLCNSHRNKDTIKKLVEKHMKFEVIPEAAENPSEPIPEILTDIRGAFHEAVRRRNKSKQ